MSTPHFEVTIGAVAVESLARRDMHVALTHALQSALPDLPVPRRWGIETISGEIVRAIDRAVGAPQ